MRALQDVQHDRAHPRELGATRVARIRMLDMMTL